jgi:hypothetical protein
MGRTAPADPGIDYRPGAGFITLAAVAVAVAGGMLIFCGKLNDFARRLI